MSVFNTWIHGLFEHNANEYVNSSRMRYIRIALRWNHNVNAISFHQMSDKKTNILVLSQKNYIVAVYELTNYSDGSRVRRVPDAVVMQLMCFHTFCGLHRYDPIIRFRGSRLFPSGVDPDDVYSRHPQPWEKVSTHSRHPHP